MSQPSLTAPSSSSKTLAAILESQLLPILQDLVQHIGDTCFFCYKCSLNLLKAMFPFFKEEDRQYALTIHPNLAKSYAQLWKIIKSINLIPAIVDKILEQCFTAMQITLSTLNLGKEMGSMILHGYRPPRGCKQKEGE